MSRVFEAEELRLKRKVAIKVLSPELAQGLSVSRFEREIQTAAALQQANIVPVLSAGDTDGLPFYTMPFVDGESLRARLGRGPLGATEVIGVLRDVSKALAYAHRQGVVHRDIKPDNVLLSEGTAVVTDFGIAKAISAARTSAPGATLTQVGTSIGTPAYMAPEQAAGDPDIDHRADIYSLGAMAYELLAGKPVFADRTAQRMLAAHMGEAPRSINEIRPDVPAPLGELVMRCLEKDPKDRPQTATEIVRVLEQITSGSGMQAMPPVLLGGPGMLRKALAIYAVAFIAVAILAKAAIVGIGLPDWVFPGSLILMALGLPVILWTGYVQRVTRRAVTATPTFTPGGTPSSVQGTMATIALRAAPHVSWYRTARGGAYALGVFVLSIAAFMSLRAMGVGPFGSLVASGKLKSKEPLLITDFHVTNADTSLGRVVSDAVRAGLSQSSVLSLMSTGAIGQILQLMEKPPLSRMDMSLAPQVAQRAGAKAIVDGDITGVGSGYIVVLRLVTADSGTELWSSRETGDGPKGLIDATDRLTRELRGKAGESLKSVQAAAPLADVTTTSLDALRKYSEGARYHDVLADWPNAIMKFREAVAIDSNFAMAWRKLGAALGNGGHPASEVNAALEQAHRHRDHLSPGERDYEEAYYYVQGPGHDRAKGVALYEGLVRRGDATAAVNLALVYLTRRQQELAESTYAKATGAGAARALAMYEITWPQMNLGHWAQAESSDSGGRTHVPEQLDGANRPRVPALSRRRTRLAPALPRCAPSQPARRSPPGGVVPGWKSCAGARPTQARAVTAFGKHRGGGCCRKRFQYHCRYRQRDTHRAGDARRIAARCRPSRCDADRQAAQGHGAGRSSILQRRSDVRATRPSGARSRRPRRVRSRRARFDVPTRARARASCGTRGDRARRKQAVRGGNRISQGRHACRTVRPRPAPFVFRLISLARSTRRTSPTRRSRTMRSSYRRRTASASMRRSSTCSPIRWIPCISRASADGSVSCTKRRAIPRRRWRSTGRSSSSGRTRSRSCSRESRKYGSG